ncbi:MAG: chemotaxis response regulator protein-glutamate methylesterase [Rhodocyclaceae bacterium]|nr:chemotaxis response regulator protein-glutamate methylesterase [Rhodocyclaceae bacterium]MBX3670585.1 chemotaxis response regulator protein-glutamate methylesterase [Rhodocyclaceae bacterium]
MSVIKVLVVDDSAVMRAVLSRVIESSPDFHVVGAAPDPLVAREMIKQLNPDVLTLDVEMPRMDGIEFLSRLMRLRPTPVIMISTLTERGSETTLQALELGAVDFVAKPKVSAAEQLQHYADEIHDKLRAAYAARSRLRARAQPAANQPAASQDLLPAGVGHDKLILIGASTGGTEAIKEVLSRLPANLPGVLIVQHMPEMFTSSFARRLDGLCALRVKEAEHGERVQAGTAYLAPGHSHLSVRRNGPGAYACELSASEPVNRHRPAVDVLFNSAVTAAGTNVVAAILTGMGKDGAQGMLALKRAGAWTIGQDEASCVVYGMPREAALIGALCETAPLTEVAGRILGALRQTRAAARKV